jgi:hypothetical protein
MVAEEGLTAREFARRVAALRSPKAPFALQLEERPEANVLSPGDLVVV